MTYARFVQNNSSAVAVFMKDLPSISLTLPVMQHAEYMVMSVAGKATQEVTNRQ